MGHLNKASVTPDKRLSILGIPFDLAAGDAGAIMGLSALRAVGFVESLTDLSYTVEDRGDIPAPEPIDVAISDADRPTTFFILQPGFGVIHDRAYNLFQINYFPR